MGQSRVLLQLTSSVNLSLLILKIMLLLIGPTFHFTCFFSTECVLKLIFRIHKLGQCRVKWQHVTTKSCLGPQQARQQLSVVHLYCGINRREHFIYVLVSLDDSYSVLAFKESLHFLFLCFLCLLVNMEQLLSERAEDNWRTSGVRPEREAAFKRVLSLKKQSPMNSCLLLRSVTVCLKAF